jgi:hypothetical protein
MSIKHQSTPGKSQEPPWYRQFWPWFIIALPASAVIASLISLYLAVSHPDPIVVEDDEYLRLKSELKAQAPSSKKQQDKTNNPDVRP